ncbi:hypothetical protein EV562_10595 [Streptomyces sp. BK208]|nr:hypothetical protein EV562_10595 [Streptomyces sp. BK208]
MRWPRPRPRPACPNGRVLVRNRRRPRPWKAGVPVPAQGTPVALGVSRRQGRARRGPVAPGRRAFRRVDLPGVKGAPSHTFANIRAVGAGVSRGCGITPRSSQGAHIVIQRCPSRVESGPPGDVSSDPCDSREQSYARGTAQWRGLRGAGSSRSAPSASPGRGRRHPASVRARHRTGRRSDRTVRHSVHPRIGRSPGVHRVPATIKGGTGASVPSGCRRTTPESSCGTPMHAASLTKGYGGNPPSGRSVSPPRTGPFFCPVSGTLLCTPWPWCARNEEFTGVPPRGVAWRRSFQGIRQAGRRPNHGCRISADGTEPSAREALCTSPTVRSRHGRRGGGPVHGPRQCRAAWRTCLTTSVRQALDRSARSRPPSAARSRSPGAARSRSPGAARSRPPGPASTPSLPDLFRGGTSFRGDQHKAPQAR